MKKLDEQIDLLRNAIFKVMQDTLTFNRDLIQIFSSPDFSSNNIITQYRFADINIIKNESFDIDKITFDIDKINEIAYELVGQFFDTYVERANKAAEMRFPIPE